MRVARLASRDEPTTLRPFVEGDFDAVLRDVVRSRGGALPLPGTAVSGGDPEPPGAEHGPIGMGCRRRLAERRGRRTRVGARGRRHGFHWVSERDRTAQIGFVFDPRHQGRGFATEAARRSSTGHSGTPASTASSAGRRRGTWRLHVCEKLGMRLEAHLVENEWVKGEWQSELVYSILTGSGASPAGAEPILFA